MNPSCDITKLIDESFDSAKRTNLPSEQVTNALETICASASENDPFKLWDAIDEEIGRAETDPLKSILIELRGRFCDHLAVSEIEAVTIAFRESADAAWKRWITFVSQSISFFRYWLTVRFCAAPFVFPADKEPLAKEVRQAATRVAQHRWPEIWQTIAALAAMEFLSAVTRARLLTIVAEIKLYWFDRTAEAENLLESADKLANDCERVTYCIGSCWLRQGRLAEAGTYFKRAVELFPTRAHGYIGMGEYWVSKNELETAEEWYKKAIAFEAGNCGGYDGLIDLCGRPEWFTTHEASLPFLIKQRLAVSPEGECQTYLNIGDIYKRNEQYDKAHQWYEKAVRLDPGNPLTYTTDANCYVEQKLYPVAENSFKIAVEVAPEAYYGYWGLADLYERQEKWAEALAYYEKALERYPERAGTLRARIGDMYAEMQNFSQAESELREALQSDKENPVPKETLQRLANRYYKRQNDVEAAQRVYKVVFDIIGDCYQADYHNQIGNLKYYFGEYSQAKEEYAKAALANPENPVFHRNLADAYRELKDYMKARKELETALRLNKDDKAYQGSMALLANAEGNDYYSADQFPEAVEKYRQAIKFDPGDDVIRSNLAGALEQLKEPGRRIESIENAIRETERAQDIAPTKGYGENVKRLNRKKAFAECYGEKALNRVQVVAPVVVEVARDLIPNIEGPHSGLATDVTKYVGQMRARVQEELGVPIPGIRFRGNESDLPDGSYIIMLAEIPAVFAKVGLDKRFFPGPPEALSALNLTGEQHSDPLTGNGGFWIHQQDWALAEAHDLELWGFVKYLINHLEALIRRSLVEFVGHQEIAGVAGYESSETSDRLKSSPEKLSALTAVCRGLLAEGVPIKPFGPIYDAFEKLGSEGQALWQIVERVRLLPEVRPKLPGNEMDYEKLRLGTEFEAAMKHFIYKNQSHSILAMYPADFQNALSGVRNAVKGSRRVALVVEDEELRPFVRVLTEIEFPSIPVLAQKELLTDLANGEVGQIAWAGEGVEGTPDFRGTEYLGTSSTVKDNAQINTSSESDKKLALAQTEKATVTVFVNTQFVAGHVESGGQPLENLLSTMQDGLFYELGIVVPDVIVTLDSTLADHEFRFQLNELASSRWDGLKQDEFLVNETVSRLEQLKFKGRAKTNPASGDEFSIIETRATRDACQKAGLTIWDSADYLVLALSAEIRKKAAAFQTHVATQYMIDSLRPGFPSLVDTALSRFSKEQIGLILKELLDEEISIRDLRSILEILLSVNGVTDVDMSDFVIFYLHVDNLCPVSQPGPQGELTVAEYADLVRASLKRYISHKYTRGAGTLIVYLLDRQIEKRLSKFGAQGVTSQERYRLIEAVRSEVHGPPVILNPVFLTSFKTRKPLHKLLAQEFPRLAVISYQELSPDMSIQPLARISWQ